MKKSARKRILLVAIIGVLAVLLIMKFGDKGSPELSARLGFKLNWNLSVPAGEEIYGYSQSYVSYYVLKYTDREEKKLMEFLREFETADGREINKEQFLQDLAVYETDIDKEQLPDFQQIDFFCKKAKGLSKLYLFYDSAGQVLYLCQLLD